ncbi:MAG TPA: hemerythrin domain-containing protein [Stellaceae bacterium]|nr:hemerythrin domain-containing protein [Stellaceae bacterium]
MECENGYRRRAILGGLAGAGVLIAAPGLASAASDNVTATEDLMREHGVLRRSVIVYREAAARLSGEGGQVPSGVLHDTALLFRRFGEDYHERQLEEAFIFPEVAKQGGALAHYADILKQQHDRGREITDYILAATHEGGPGTDLQRLSTTLLQFARMYERHMADEDTVVFTAWKKALSASRYKDMGEKFEEIEHKTFGADGFDEGVSTIARIETELGIADIAGFTAPAPPHA